ncbi:hypothetical protein Tco_0489977 [Tanacetum coccineum]
MKSRRSHQKLRKLVNEQLESEVLVRSLKEAKTSHAVAVNLSELELKKILIDKMELTTLSTASDIQKVTLQGISFEYEADKFGIDTYAGYKKEGQERTESTSAFQRKGTTLDSRNRLLQVLRSKQSASQSAPVEETMQSIDVFEAPAHQEFESGVP